VTFNSDSLLIVFYWLAKTSVMQSKMKNSLGEVVRVNSPSRHQEEFGYYCLDELVCESHEIRSIWQYVSNLDLSSFYAGFRSVEGKTGRTPVDPRILLTLWIFAIIEGISSGRHLARLCERDSVYRWVCGHVGVNYNLLNEFRVNHQDALCDLMSQTIAVLQHHELIDFKRISQDGIRVRAHAGKGSFRRKETLEELLVLANREVARVLSELDCQSSNAQQAAQFQAAQDRQRRVAAAVEDYKTFSAEREKRKKGDGVKTRVSTTDPEARNMKMADGGFRPALNIQAATLNDSRIIVDIHATNEGTDSRQVAPMLDRVESNFGERPQEVLADGGYNSLSDVTQVEASGAELYSPVRKARNSDRDPHDPRKGDTEEVKRWRARMKTPEALAIYKERCSTAEFPFARFRNHGLGQLPVRGIQKAQTIGLWHALVHNLRQIFTKNWLPMFTS